MKVRDLAKKFKMQGKDLLSLLEKDIGIKGKNTVSVLSDKEIEKVDQYMKKTIKKKTEKKETKAKTAKKAATTKTKVVKEPKAKATKKTVTTKAKPKKETKAKPVKETKKTATTKAKPKKEAKVKPVAKKTEDTKARPTKATKKTVPAKTKQPPATKITEKQATPAVKKVAQEPKKTAADTLSQKKVVAPSAKKSVQLEGIENIKALSEKIKMPVNEIIKYFFTRGIPCTINQCPGKENIKQLCEHIGLDIEFYTPTAEKEPEEIKERTLIPRVPVVTIMGHVDHGKTTILDTIRKSRVAEKEFGKITQRIGAYKFNTPKGSIVFLDTPGHEAFTAMRARGAMITDIVILVVAADEGIKPQTIEAINHAKSANVPIIVALNKIDKPNINIDKIKKQLAEHQLLSEDWGGDTIFVNVSGLTGEGINSLIDMTILLGEMLELKATIEGEAEGVVIESHIDKSKGSIMNVLIRNGVLKTGDHFIAGEVKGKVRAIMDDWGERVEQAGPSTPVEILGGEGVATPGEIFKVVASEKIAREIIDKQKRSVASKDTVDRKITLENLYTEIQKGEVKEFKLILKTDFSGTVEAIKNIIEKMPTSEIKIDVIHSEVGAISESDILLASASNAVVLGFNVPVLQKAEELAKNEKVEVRTYRVVYELADEIRRAIEGMLEPEEKEILSGQALVKKVFRLSDNTAVAGCLVVDGVILRNSLAKVVRSGSVIHQGAMSSLKRFKENVREVKKNTECGIGVEKFDDLQEGDVIQSYTKTLVPRKI